MPSHWQTNKSKEKLSHGPKFRNNFRDDALIPFGVRPDGGKRLGKRAQKCGGGRKRGATLPQRSFPTPLIHNKLSGSRSAQSQPTPPSAPSFSSFLHSFSFFCWLCCSSVFIMCSLPFFSDCSRLAHPLPPGAFCLKRHKVRHLGHNQIGPQLELPLRAN